MTNSNSSSLKDVKIVASDLDGTLLAPDHLLSDFTKKTLKDLHKQGFTFIFATGRHHVDVAHIRKQTGIPAYMITSNGARVHDQQDNLMYSQNVPEGLIQSVVDIIKQDPKIIIHIYQDETWLLNQENERLRNFHKDSGFSYQLFNDDASPCEHVAKLFFTYPDHDHLVKFEDELNAKFGDQLNIAFSTPHCLEVMAAEVSKGEALKAIAESLDLTLDNCIAFGDGMNDAEMLAMAGHGKVMATSHQKVKDALPNNEVIGSNEDDGVAKYLIEHLLK